MATKAHGGAAAATGAACRQEADERAVSPERLDQYIRVSSPRGWVLLALTALLVVAAGAYCLLATVPTVERVDVTVEDGRLAGAAPQLADGTYTVEVETGEQRLVDAMLGQ